MNRNNSTVLTATLAAFLIFLTQGYFLVLSGALTPFLSVYYNKSLSVIGFMFTAITIVRIAGNIFGGKILPRINLHLFVVLTTGVVVSSLILVFLLDTIWAFIICNIFCSFTLGMLYALSNNLILTLYNGKQRAAKISLMTSFYSIGAILSSFTFSYILRISARWSLIYILTAITALTALLCLKSEPYILSAEHKSVVLPKFKLNGNIRLSTFSLFLYMIAEISYTLWMPVFLTDKLDLPLADAAFSLVLLWSGFTVGRIITGSVAKRFASHKIIFTLTCIITLSIILLFTSLTTANYMFIVLLLGLGLSAMYSMILAFGNDQSHKPDSRLMNLLTTVGSIGSLIGMFASSLMKAFVSADIIFLSAGAALLIAVLCVIVCLLRKKKEMASD